MFFFTGHKADPKKHVLIMDEVDGMAGNEDRGGMQVRERHTIKPLTDKNFIMHSLRVLSIKPFVWKIWSGVNWKVQFQ